MLYKSYQTKDEPFSFHLDFLQYHIATKVWKINSVNSSSTANSYAAIYAKPPGEGKRWKCVPNLQKSAFCSRSNQ